MLFEIIGTPGSGKSTFLKQLNRKYDFNNNFYFWNQVKNKCIYHFIKSHNMNVGNLIYFPNKILWSIPILKKYLSDYCFYRFVKYSPLLYEKIIEYYVINIIGSIISNDELTTNTKPFYINHELEKIAKFIILRKYSNYTNRNIIMEEGLLTSFNTMDYKPELLNRELLPDVVIFIKTKPEMAVNGIIKRKKNGVINQSQINKTDIEIYNYIKNKYNKYIKTIKYLNQIKVPVIVYEREKKSIQEIYHEMIKEAQKDK